MATLWIAAWEFSLDEVGDTLAVPVDGIGNDCEFGSDGGEVDRSHDFTLGCSINSHDGSGKSSEKSVELVR